MSISRRLFMRAAPAAPFAAKAAVTAAAQEAAAGMAMANEVGLLMSGPSQTAWTPHHDTASKKLRDFFFAGDIPEWEKPQMRSYARQRAIVQDPDIGSMRSVSASVRYLWQQEREYQRLIERRRNDEIASRGFQGLVDRISKGVLG